MEAFWPLVLVALAVPPTSMYEVVPEAFNFMAAAAPELLMSTTPEFPPMVRSFAEFPTVKATPVVIPDFPKSVGDVDPTLRIPAGSNLKVSASEPAFLKSIEAAVEGAALVGSV